MHQCTPSLTLALELQGETVDEELHQEQIVVRHTLLRQLGLHQMPVNKKRGDQAFPTVQKACCWCAAGRNREVKDSFRGLHAVWDCWEEERGVGGTISDAVQLDTEVLYTGPACCLQWGRGGGGTISDVIQLETVGSE